MQFIIKEILHEQILGKKSIIKEKIKNIRTRKHLWDTHFF